MNTTAANKMISNRKEAVSRDAEDFLLKARLAKIAILQRGENK